MGLGRKVSRKGRRGVKSTGATLKAGVKANHEVNSVANTVAEYADDIASGAGVVGKLGS